MKLVSFSQKLGIAVLAVALCLVVSGCGKGGGGGDSNANVTKENYDKIKDGMSEAGVVAILGPPSDTSTPPNQPNMKPLSWKNGNNLIALGFKDGKVETKQSQFVK